MKTTYLQLQLDPSTNPAEQNNLLVIDSVFGSLITTNSATLSGGTISVANGTVATNPLSRIVYSLKTPSASNPTGAYGSTVNNSNLLSITTVCATGSIVIGMQVAGTGIPSNTYITGLSSGIANTTSAVYTMSALATATETAEALTLSFTSGTGASASFLNNIMTVTVAPSGGYFTLGQTVTGTNIPNGTTITGLVSGTMSALGSVYTLSNSVVGGLQASEAITTYGQIGTISCVVTPGVSTVFTSSYTIDTSVVNFQVVGFATGEPVLVADASQDTQVIPVTKANY